MNTAARSLTLTVVVMATLIFARPVYAENGYLATTPADLRVGPLLGDICWGLSDPYCVATPKGYQPGCGAVAAGMIMRSKMMPTGKLWDIAPTCTFEVDSQITTGQLQGNSCDWANMPATLTTSSSEAQKLAVSTFLANLGKASCANYKGITEIDESNLAGAMSSLFQLGPIGDSWINFSDAEMFRKTACSNLDAGLAVIVRVGGVGTTLHVVVIDGYGYQNDQLYYHLNYGSNGNHNGWYTLPNSGYNYTTAIVRLYNIGVDGQIVSGRLLKSDGTPKSGVTVTLQPVGGTKRTTKTGPRGIYAFKGAPSNTSFTVKASGFVTQTITTGANGWDYSGNVFGVNLAVATPIPTPTPEPLAVANWGIYE